MKIIKTVSGWCDYRRTIDTKKIGFVPTMGALHDGHVSLIKKSLSENEVTVVSIYLNPTQFNDSSDLENYPETWDEDLTILNQLGVDVLFAPDYNEMYPDKYNYRVIEFELSKKLCGAARPGHFEGVLTIVLKFFLIIGSCKAYFGEKDYQQYLLIKNMTKAYFIPVEVIPCPTIREDDGLAMSSRNVKLSTRGRKTAPLLYKHLSSNLSLSEVQKKLENEGFKIDYLEKIADRKFGAVFLDGVRLIDNVKT